MSSDHDLGLSGHLVLGRYRVMHRLAQGGMGVVYLGRLEGAAGFAKPVVIKRIIQDSEEPTESTARFIREAQILSNLQHPGIVGVLDFGEEAEGHAMILEYVHGYDLGRWLKYLQIVSAHMHWEEAVFILLRVLDALSYAHAFRRSDGVAAQVLHRDISPGNVLIDVEGRVRLLDFGIARMAEDDQYRTQTGVLKGKVPFLAPELFASDPPSAASDIYACGVVLYQMLTGSHPFTGENDSKLMWRIITEGPKPLSHWRNDLPVGLEAPIFTALDKDPGKRHASAESFAAELRQTLCRRETEIAVGLRERVRRDFNGEMPGRLRLESLADRDRAWRQVRVSLPPGAALPGRAVPTTVDAPRVSTRGSQPTLTASTEEQDPKPATERTRNASRRASAETRPRSSPALASPALASPALASPALRSEWRSLVSLGIGLGLVVAALLVLVLHFVDQRGTPAGAARFIVVESPDKVVAGSAGAPPVSATVLPPSPGPPSVAAEVSGRSPAASATRASEKGSDAAALSRRFARREGALQQCFERLASGLSGAPQISVYFQVTAAGKVQAATLEPGSLEGTPLGHCLLEVARGTAFGALGKPLRFSIPIRARSVTR